MDTFGNTILGYRFQDSTLLIEALTHPSYANEHQGRDGTYQRLEFLGDALIGFVLADMLSVQFPEANEGILSKLRSRLVDQSSLAHHAEQSGLVSLLRLGRGAESEGSRNSSAIHADLFEAVIAAIYRDGGFEIARQVIVQQFQAAVSQISVSPELDDSKSALQEWLEQHHRPIPQYTVLTVDGPEHDPRFTVLVTSGDQPLAQGSGRSKKIAQQAAARAALVLVKNN